MIYEKILRDDKKSFLCLLNLNFNGIDGVVRQKQSIKQNVTKDTENL
jgi:hypothetical protein